MLCKENTYNRAPANVSYKGADVLQLIKAKSKFQNISPSEHQIMEIEILCLTLTFCAQLKKFPTALEKFLPFAFWFFNNSRKF